MSNGWQIGDGTSRHHVRGQDLRLECNIGTFAHHTVVHEDSCVVIDDVALEYACLLACSVPTGWGSVVNVAQVHTGDSVAIVGVGGLGANAIQAASQLGARHMFAINPVEFKREMAHELGATHTFASLTEARDAIATITPTSP